MKLTTKRIFTKSLIASGLMLAISQAYAQDQTEVEQLRQEVKELKTMLQNYVNQPKVQLSPAVVAEPVAKPTNVLNTVKSNTEITLYGNVRADASYQFKGPNSMYNLISAVPLEGTEAERKNSDKFQSTLNATRFGLNFKTPISGDHNLGGKLEMDFFGGAGRDTFRIRHAYLTYDDWLVGQTWSNFNALEYFPETVDASLSVGGSLTRVPQIKYTVPVDQKLNLAFSLEDSKAETVTTAGTQNFTTDPDAKLKLPSATGRINYKFDNGSALSGRAFLTQKATNHESNDDFLAWGAALGGKYQVTDSTLLRFDYNHIKGDTKNVLWSNMAYVFDQNGKMRANEFDVLTLGITQKITPKLRSTLGMGYMKAKDDNAFATLVKDVTTQNESLKEAWINMFYTPVKTLNFGVEYMYGERKTFNDLTGKDNRINFTAIYDF
ncbi:DcaP family trimeric outer membrane transporter [Acinetobacter albensis]|uniref:DcaP family trimeric outer membrane transporter n=1 Tax=Acinetobacter albensis TaxID=1673609 RepID=A0ABW9JVD9_9GAMM